MIRAYVFDGGYLAERLVLESPLPVLFLMKKKPLSLCLDDGAIPTQEACIEKTEYKYLFRSPNNEVLIYANEDPLTFMERAIKFDLIGKGECVWKKYESPIVMSFERREVIEKIIKRFIPIIRRESENADAVIAETCAKEISSYMTRN